MSMNKVENFNSKLPKAIQSYTSLLENAIKSQISSPYERILDLPSVMRLPTDTEILSPNLNNPSQTDVAYTVHVISRIESEIMYHDSKFSTGLYNFDFSRRVYALHALAHEQAILTQQLAAIEANKPKPVSAPIAEKISAPAKPQVVSSFSGNMVGAK